MEFDTSNERITYVEGKLTPSDEDFCKQDFKRDPSTSRARFYARYPTYRNAPELADKMQAYFDGLPQWKPRLNRKGERY